MSVLLAFFILVLSLPVMADSNTVKCDFEEKTVYSTDKSSTDSDLSELIEQARSVHGLSDKAQIKIITTDFACDGLHKEIPSPKLVDKNGSGLPECDHVGCVENFPSTAQEITMVFCESYVKTTIEYRKMPDGRYEIVEVHQELVTECTLGPEDGGNGPE